jgi:serine/threonine protein kinase/tetratricopeptide (TPR) repeat protein
MPKQPTEEQLARYVAGDCSQEESQAIEAFLEQSPEAREWVDRARANAAWLDGVQKAAGRNKPDPDETQDAIGATALAAGEQACSSASPSYVPQVDGYEIVRELSRGGQGVVYQAIQQSTRRKVAIKVLLEGPYASKAAHRRFEREIELIAQLKHSNIISIFHSGATSDGRQFYVMDYVRGTPLHQYVRERKLTLEATLKLFATVCEAVQYAHQKGIIHRDLKPSNILVEADGTPKVMDFGLAKLLAGPVETLVSISQEMVGTLPYMSPEQARGNPDEVDTRTDIYALGVILYELLTGHYPYPVVGQIMEVLKHITETPATPPSKRWTSDSGVTRRNSGKLRLGQCPIDDEVQTLVLKALSKERERRYQSAGELARDIGHYLAGEPIEAKRDSGWYILRKQLRRHRVPVGLLGCLALIVVAALAVVSSLSMKLHEAREAETLKRQEAERQRAVAMENEERALRAESAAEQEADRARREADRAMAVNAFLHQMLSGERDLSSHAEPEPTFLRADAVREILDNAAERLEQDLDEYPDICASLRITIGAAYEQVGLFDQAARHLRAAVDYYDTPRRSDVEPLMRSLRYLASVRNLQGLFEDAQRLIERALAIVPADDSSYREERWRCRRLLASVLANRGSLDEAGTILEDVWEESIRSTGRNSSLSLHFERTVAKNLETRGHLDEALEHLESIVQSSRTALGARHYCTLHFINDLAWLKRLTGEYDQAEQLYAALLSDYEDLLGPADDKTLTTSLDLALLYDERGHTDEAQAMLRHVMTVGAEQHGPWSRIVRIATERLSGSLAAQGKFNEARSHLEGLIESEQAAFGRLERNTLGSMNTLAWYCASEGDYTAAEGIYREVILKRTELLGSAHHETLVSQVDLANLLYNDGRLNEAEDVLLKVVETAQLAGVTAPPVGLVYERLIGLYGIMGRQADAKKWESEQAAIFDGGDGEGGPISP